jgi:hypothetical protein
VRSRRDRGGAAQAVAQGSPRGHRARTTGPTSGIETETRPGGEPGVFVAYIHPMSPAKEIGFQIGDELRAVNDVLIATPEAFVKEIRAQNIGAKLRFLIRRGGQDVRVEGRLGATRRRCSPTRRPSVRRWWESRSRLRPRPSGGTCPRRAGRKGRASSTASRAATRWSSRSMTVRSASATGTRRSSR